MSKSKEDTVTDEPQVLRRPSTYSRAFVARPVEQPDVTLERNVLRPSTTNTKPQTKRQREMVGDLPDWAPMPPGELELKRPKSKGASTKKRTRRT